MSETPAEELYLRGYRPASKTWNGLLRWLPVSLPAEDDVLYIRADLYEAQAAEIAALREQLARSCDDERADPEGLACPIGANLNLAERRITAQAAEIDRLRADAERYRYLKNNMSKTRPYGDVYAQENEAFTNRFVRSYTQRCWDIRFISTDQFDNIDDAIDAEQNP